MKTWQAVITTLVIIILVIIGIIVFRKSPEAPTMTPSTVSDGHSDNIPTIVDICKGKNPPSDCLKG